MDISQIVIVLCRPEHSTNIGSVCRAMMNMGIKKLRIVGTKENYDESAVRTLAVHAFGIWEHARFYGNLKQATADCILSAGTTRRRGQKRKRFLLLPEECANKLLSLPAGKSCKAAIVFGNERTGLTDEELQDCILGVTIPSHPKSPSLNLSHAVQIIAYELYRKSVRTAPGYTAVPLKRLDKTVHSITENLKKIGFFSLNGETDMHDFWISVLSRAALSTSEAEYMEKTFTKASALALKNKGNVFV